MKFRSDRLSHFLANHNIFMTIYAFACSFLCYFCVYAYRKPFAAAEYLGLTIYGIQYKIMLITFQEIGYTISKFSGIKIISELNKNHRDKLIIFSVVLAEISLLFFYLVPTPYNSIFLFFNSLPLGIIWGLVFSYIEGRKTSEVLGCGMCISFIVASGAVKAVGRSLLNDGVSEFLMPFVVGLIFFPILLISVFLLNSIPPPTEEDVKSRTERVKMNHSDRVRLLKKFGPGILCMTLFYMLLSAYREFRENFAAELWSHFGYLGVPSIFATSELIVAIIVVIPVGFFMLIKNNIKVLVSYHFLIILSMFLTTFCAYLYDNGAIKSGLLMMVLTGVGLNLAYVPFNSILYDLLLSTFEYKANSGFLMYISDSFGYLTSVIVLFIKNFAAPKLSWLSFFIRITYILGLSGIFLMTLSLIYYVLKYNRWTKLYKDRVNEPLIIQKTELL